MTRPLNILHACEYSGVGRDASLAYGHNAISCDLIPTESPGPHHEGDVFEVLADQRRFFGGPIDLMIAHPPCTFLTNAANGSLDKRELSKNPEILTGPARFKALIDGAVFFRTLLDADVPRVAIENPRMNPYAKKVIGVEPTQYVQPYEFGHTETKGIFLWLRGLPPLLAGEDAEAAMMRLPYRERAVVHSMGPSPERGKKRSIWFPGVAEAMTLQWAGDARTAEARAHARDELAWATGDPG